MLNRSMTRFALCLAAFLLGAFVALGGEPEIQQVDFHLLAPNAEIRLRTETQVLELQMIDPDQGAAVVRISRDGSEFGSPRLGNPARGHSGPAAGSVVLDRNGCNS